MYKQYIHISQRRARRVQWFQKSAVDKTASNSSGGVDALPRILMKLTLKTDYEGALLYEYAANGNYVKSNQISKDKIYA